MAWYYGTFICGHEGRVNITGPHKHREWKKERAFEKMCPECYEKYLQEEREKANKEAAAKAAEMELPELTGTEKQVAWANTLRQEMIDRLEKEIEDFESDEIEEKEEISEILEYILKNKTDASWYIDNRTRSIYDVIDKIKRQMPSEEEIIKKKLEEEIKAEATVYPEDCKYKGVAEIKIMDDKISVTYEKNKDFISIVKSLDYKWEGIWEKKIKETTGSAAERAAELGNKLLNAGFPIMILNEEIRNNAINGVYEPECTRWIYFRTSGKYEGRLDITWKGMNDKLYRTARSLPSSKWDSGVVVKIEYFEEVQEFAELYNFKFTKAAFEAIERYIDSQRLSQQVEPAPAKEVQNKDGLKEILNSDIGILPDLLDED